MCKRVLVLVPLLLLILFSAHAQTNLPPPATAVRSEPIALTVTVTDKKGRPVGGLKASDFVIAEGKVAQPIVSFDHVDGPVSVGIVFDASDSMGLGSRPATQRKRNTLISALDRFLDSGNDANEYFVQTFGSQTSLILDWTSDQPTIVIALASVPPQGQTALYDGLFSAIQKLKDARHSKRVLLLITDHPLVRKNGTDSKSRSLSPQTIQAKRGSCGPGLVRAITNIDPITLLNDVRFN